MKKNTWLFIIWIGSILLGTYFFNLGYKECGCIFYSTSLIIVSLAVIFTSDD